MTFATMGDTNYTGLIDLNVKQIKKLHPESDVIVHRFNPCGFNEAVKEKIVMLMKAPLPCVYIDGDAILIRKLDIKYDADVVVTVRDHPRKNARINNGFFILNNRNFLTDWMNQIERMPGKSRWDEQDAFNIVAYSGKYAIKEVSCEKYNYTRVEDGIPDDVRVVHMKKRRYKNPKLMKRLCDLL